ncbi:MAG: hypothetical protein MRJ67_14575 [Nitrospirales bacterium]|nr:hypothetical protein [Nitrospirales bacterium]MDR4482155.1 hypothetical protein [Nitrospirales bacterium]
MWRKILVLLVAVIVGYVSNVSSQGACLENATFWYSHVMMSSQPFFVKLEPGQDHIRRALNTVDAPYTVLRSDSDQQAYPRVIITTSFWLPFFVSEHFHTSGDATRRVVFTAHYLGLFGFALSIGDSVEIAA